MPPCTAVSARDTPAVSARPVKAISGGCSRWPDRKNKACVACVDRGFGRRLGIAVLSTGVVHVACVSAGRSAADAKGSAGELHAAAVAALTHRLPSAPCFLEYGGLLLTLKGVIDVVKKTVKTVLH